MSTFVCPPEREEGFTAVKRAVGVHHHYLDGWMYLFYENKKFDFKETVAKLERRDHMERTVFVNYTITPSLRQSMRAGIVQYIGRDKEGRPVLYFNTARDSPTADQRPERQANMDMFLSWAVRCDPVNPTSTVTWLINQQDASIMGNTDLIFQKNMALRISKFFPGVVAKMYICNMGSALTFVMKPLLKQLPKAISECIYLYSAGDIRRGKLLEVIDADVLPIAMGGNNNIDNKQNYELFATTIEAYFDRCQQALHSGITIKQMEMMESFPVDKDGNPRPTAKARAETLPLPSADRAAGHGGREEDSAFSSSKVRFKRIEEAGEETLDLCTPLVVQTPSKICVDRGSKEAIVVMSSSLKRERRKTTTRGDVDNGLGPHGAGEGGPTRAETGDDDCDVLSPSISHASLLPTDNGNATSQGGRHMTFFRSGSHADVICASLGGGRGAGGGSGVSAPTARQVDTHGLPELHIDTIEVFSYESIVPLVRLSHEQVCELQRSWTQFLCHSVTLIPQLLLLMEALRDDDLLTDEVLQLSESIPLIRRVMHHVLDLFPQTTEPLYYPIFHWLTAGLDRKHQVVTNDNVKDRVAMDCTSPDNFLLSTQGSAVEYVDECEGLLEVDKMTDRILRRVVLSWPVNVAYDALVGSLRAKAKDLWRQLVPLFQRYIESKVAMSIGEFIDHYGLLASGGRIDTRAPWYSSLFTGLVQYRELHRKNWLFYVFPPLFASDPSNVSGGGSPDSNSVSRSNSRSSASAPTMAEMLHAHGRRCQPGGAAENLTSLSTISEFIIRVERSLQGTREQLGATSVAKIASHVAVEKYMEETGTKVYIPYEAQVTGFKPKELVAAEKDSGRQLLEAAEPPLKEFLFVDAILYILEKGVPQDTTPAWLASSSTEPPAAAPATAAARPKRDAVLQQVSVARRHCQDQAESRRCSRRIAVSMAQTAYEVQGTFTGVGTGAGGEGGPALSVYGGSDAQPRPMRPDGYALALDLLLVEALVSDRLPLQQGTVNESFAFALDGGGGANERHRRGSPGITPPQPPIAAAAKSRPDAVAEDGSDDDEMRSACSAEPVDVAAFVETIAAMDAAALPLAATKRQVLRA